MQSEEFKIKVEDFFRDGKYELCISWCFGAIFSISGLAWPYFYLAESLFLLDRGMESAPFFRLYLIRAHEESKSRDFISIANKRLKKLLEQRENE